MVKRITITLDTEILKKLRKKQAALIIENTRSVSFSEVVNEILRKHFR